MVEDIWSNEKIKKILVSEDESIVNRMRALFYARHHNNYAAFDAIKAGLWHPSVLLKHEIAYVMGQMNVPEAVDVLINLCDDHSEHPMVRHEAGEALCALGVITDKVFDCIERNINDPHEAVRETFYLAKIGLQRKAEKLREVNYITKEKIFNEKFYIFTNNTQQKSENDEIYDYTKDPAEGNKLLQKEGEIENLGKVLSDESARLWDRYVAMFTLRNINTTNAAMALANALDEKKSALLRHEIAFVLGQMQKPETVYKLAERLDDINEADMCRHEAALSLGSVGALNWTSMDITANKVALEILSKYSKDPNPIVAESCIVALDNIYTETN